MRITFLRSKRDRSKVTFDFLFPIFMARKRLEGRGLQVDVRDEPTEQLLDADVACILSSCVRYHKQDPRYRKRLSELVDQAKAVYFFDTADSAGALYHEYLGRVDRYLKKQVYKDRDLYTMET